MIASQADLCFTPYLIIQIIFSLKQNFELVHNLEHDESGDPYQHSPHPPPRLPKHQNHQDYWIQNDIYEQSLKQKGTKKF